VKSFTTRVRSYSFFLSTPPLCAHTIPPTEDDVHAATLTVAQTLLFALSLKTPGKLLPGKNKKELQHEVLDVLTKMLGISHTKDTKVGSAYVRGVSGGERKRVSIAEMVRLHRVLCFFLSSSL
jgi:ATP-binding cassette subfamily G (WHITE) protein 2 (SNQ2)